MRFRTKTWAAMAISGVVPLLLLGWLSFRTGHQELEKTVGRLQSQNAREVARYCKRLIDRAVGNLQLMVSYIPFDELEREELVSVLSIPYRQFSYVNAILLLDEKGRAVVPPVYQRSKYYIESTDRELIKEDDLRQTARSAPLQEALTFGVAIGKPFRRAKRYSAVTIAVRIDALKTNSHLVLVAEISLKEMHRQVENLAQAGSIAFFVDSFGELLAHGWGSTASIGEEERLLVRKGLQTGLIVNQVKHGDEFWLAAFAPVEGLGWGVVVAETAAKAFRASNRVRDLTIQWGALSLLLTLGLGAVLARGLTRPIGMLSEVAKAASAGAYQPAMQVEGNDELGQFGKAFNRMIAEILGRDLEIRRWNEELLQRVDKRTSELREAENQILRARRLAALGSLGAGIAHELNNPLTAIIGLVTIAQRELGDSPQAKVLGVALEQARRVARIIADLRQLTAAETENGGKCFQLIHPIRVALQSCAQDLHDREINLQTEFSSALPEIQGNPEQIRTMVIHLITNAINAMPQGGKLEVGVHAVENEAIRFWIRDTGKGISPMLLDRIFDPFFTTKDYPSQLGMGLSICHAIVEAHHGKISVESIVGVGTTFCVLFPIAVPHGHLY